MRIYLKRNKGITLIALIVTIIVLLILASISIGVITGENGIIKMAQEAKENSEIADETEMIDLATIKAMKKDRFGDITKTNLQEALDEIVGKSKTEVTELLEEDIFFVKFIDSGKIPLGESIYYENREYTKTFKVGEKTYDLNFYRKDDKIICELVSEM